MMRSEKSASLDTMASRSCRAWRQSSESVGWGPRVAVATIGREGTERQPGRQVLVEEEALHATGWTE